MYCSSIYALKTINIYSNQLYHTTQGEIVTLIQITPSLHIIYANAENQSLQSPRGKICCQEKWVILLRCDLSKGIMKKYFNRLKQDFCKFTSSSYEVCKSNNRQIIDWYLNFPPLFKVQEKNKKVHFQARWNFIHKMTLDDFGVLVCQSTYHN